MQESKALALIPTAEELTSITTIARAMHASGYWPDLKSEGQAVVRAIAGREYGYGPFEAMQAIAIVQGKPTLTAQAVAARVKASGKYNYRLLKHTSEVCEIQFFEQGQSVGVVSFTIDDAKKASLTGKQVWTAYPESMLFARAITKGARMYCPDVFGAAPAYTAEELGADVTESGEVVSVPAESVRVVEPAPEVGQRVDNAPKALPQTFDPQHGGLATPNQLRAIYAIGRDKLGMAEADVEERSMETFGMPPNGLTKKQASDFIQALQAGQLPEAPTQAGF